MSEPKICALPNCGKAIRLGSQVYVLAGYLGVEYCSRSCVEQAYNEWKAKTAPKEESKVDRLAEEFGDAGVIRRFCDRCQSPITLAWKGRYGEYCSLVCRDLAEKGEQQVPDETNDTAAAPAASPITAGASKKKAPAKKNAPAAKLAAKKATPATKTAPVMPNGRSKYPDEATVKVLNAVHGLRGFRGDALDCLLKDGQTMAKFRAALVKKGGRMNSYFGFATAYAVDNKLASIKS